MVTGIDTGLGCGAIVRGASLAAVPWANRGGVTRVIADRPGAFRLSLATIAADGPFSRLPGLWRHFALVAGRVVLTGDLAHRLDDGSRPIAFDGARAVHAVLAGGPALALNLMVPDAAPRLGLSRSEGGTVEDAVAIFACGPVTIEGAIALAPHDTLLPDRPLRFSGRALVVLR